MNTEYYYNEFDLAELNYVPLTVLEFESNYSPSKTVYSDKDNETVDVNDSYYISEGLILFPRLNHAIGFYCPCSHIYLLYFTEYVENPPIYDNSSYIGSGRQQIGNSSASDDDAPIIKTLTELPNSNLTIGSMVEVNIFENSLENIYGVIRWIGEITKSNKPNSRNLLVGIELEDEPVDKTVKLTDGTYYDRRLFKCPSGRALFISPSLCTKDKRFHDEVVPPTPNMSDPNFKLFGHVECPIVTGSIPPLGKFYFLYTLFILINRVPIVELLKQKDLEDICGQFKGIQGHHNSCYLDATLFSMFTFTSVFDSLLYRPPEPEVNTAYALLS